MAIEIQELNETFSINLRKKKLKDWVDDIQGYTKELDCDELDRRFASQAIAFVVKHSRKGVVSLCTSVATLLQEKYKLQLANKRLQKKLLYLKGESDVTASSLSSSCFPSADEAQTPSNGRNKVEELVAESLTSTNHTEDKTVNENHKTLQRVDAASSSGSMQIECHDVRTLTDSHVPVRSNTCVVTVAEIHAPPRQNKQESLDPTEKDENLCDRVALRHKVSSENNELLSESERTSKAAIVAPCPLVSCICERCKLASNCAEMYSLTYEGKPILEVGDSVLTKDNLIGAVMCVGHSDGDSDNTIYARLRIDYYGGDDGETESKIFYQDVLLTDIRCVLPKPPH